MALRKFYQLAEAFQSLRGAAAPSITQNQNSYIQQFNKLFSTANVDLACGGNKSNDAASKCPKQNNKCPNKQSKCPGESKNKCPGDSQSKCPSDPCAKKSSNKCSSSNKCPGDSESKCPSDSSNRCPSCPGDSSNKCPANQSQSSCSNVGQSCGNGKNGKKERLCSEKNPPARYVRPKKDCNKEKEDKSQQKTKASCKDKSESSEKKSSGSCPQKDKTKKMGNCKKGQAVGENEKSKDGSNKPGCGIPESGKTNVVASSNSPPKIVANLSKSEEKSGSPPPETLLKYQEKEKDKNKPSPDESMMARVAERFFGRCKKEK